MGFQRLHFGLIKPDHPLVMTEMERLSETFDPDRPWVNKDGRPYRLSDRVWDSGQLTRANIDTMVKQSIAAGDDALKTAKKLEQYLLPELRPLRTETGRLRRNQPKRIVTATPGRNGKGSYPARRLMRTEVARAHAEGTRDAALLNPFAETMSYNLSAQHPADDECDREAGRDLGFGPGRYPVKDCPIPPLHPHCLCFLTVNPPKNASAVVDQLKLKYNLAPPGSDSFVFPDDRFSTQVDRAIERAAQHVLDRQSKAAAKVLAGGQSAAQTAAIDEALEAGIPVIIPEAPSAIAARTEATLIREEDLIRTANTESAIAVDPKTGDVVFRKTTGQHAQVSFTVEEQRSLEDMVMTHNHPRGWAEPVGSLGRQGNHFSDADLDFTVGGNLAGIRAVSPRWRFELLRPAGGWPPIDELQAAMKQIQAEVLSQYFGEINAGTRTIAQANAEHSYEVNRRLADRFGWSVRQIDDPHPTFFGGNS